MMSSMINQVLHNVSPQPSLGLFFKLARTGGIDASRPEDSFERPSVDMLARFVTSYVLFNFFAVAGFLYNAGAAAAKFGWCVYQRGDNQETARFTQEVLQHTASVACELGLYYISTPLAVLYAVGPGPVQRTFAEITQMIARFGVPEAPKAP
jgi:hypothetical protein